MLIRVRRHVCSRPVVIVLSIRSTCRIYGGSRNPILLPNLNHLCCLYTWTWQPIHPAACILLCRLILHAQPRIPQLPPLFWSAIVLVSRARLLPPLVVGRSLACETMLVPIFMGCLFSYGCLYLRRACQNGNGCLFHGVPIIPILRYCRYFPRHCSVA